MSQCNVCWQDETEVDSAKHDHTIALSHGWQQTNCTSSWTVTRHSCTLQLSPMSGRWVAGCDQSLPVAGNKKPTRDRLEADKRLARSRHSGQETDESPHGSVFHFLSGMPRPLRPWGPLHKMQTQQNSLCHRGPQTNRFFLLASDSTTTLSHFLSVLLIPLAVPPQPPRPSNPWPPWPSPPPLHGLQIHDLICRRVVSTGKKLSCVVRLLVSNHSWHQQVMSRYWTMSCNVHSLNISLLRA